MEALELIRERTDKPCNISLLKTSRQCLFTQIETSFSVGGEITQLKGIKSKDNSINGPMANYVVWVNIDVLMHLNAFVSYRGI